MSLMAVRGRGMGAAVALASVALACSSTPDRPSFADPGDASTEPEEQDAAPAPVIPPAPVPDAGGERDAGACTTTAPSHRCGLVPQCGCAPTETCDVVDLEGNVRCVPFGKAPEGHPCTATVGCQKGLSCVFGTCHRLCDTPGAACAGAGAGSCVQVVGEGGVPYRNLAVCTVDCALHDAATCGGRTRAGDGVCAVFEGGVTDCRAGGSRAENQSCSPTAECGPALVCISPGTCKRWCRVGTSDCGGTTACRAFSTKVMVGTVEYGACP